jgi:hypothetical protein
MDFERTLDVHVTRMKKMIKGKYLHSEDAVARERREMVRNSQNLSRQISDLFNSVIMGTRFELIWKEYIDNVYSYMDAVFIPDTCPDFGDNNEYREAKKAVRKLRKCSGDLIGFFVHYLHNRHSFKPNWTIFIQSLKESIDDGVKLHQRRGSHKQFTKTIRRCRRYGKKFGAVINGYR